jgi:hypothetical protein
MLFYLPRTLKGSTETMIRSQRSLHNKMLSRSLLRWTPQGNWSPHIQFRQPTSGTVLWVSTSKMCTSIVSWAPSVQLLDLESLIRCSELYVQMSEAILTCNRVIVSKYVNIKTNYLYSSCVGAQGDTCAATNSDLLCFSIWFLIIPVSSTRALWQLPAETSSSETGETWGENGRWILPTKYL